MIKTPNTSFQTQPKKWRVQCTVQERETQLFLATTQAAHIISHITTRFLHPYKMISVFYPLLNKRCLERTGHTLAYFSTQKNESRQKQDKAGSELSNWKEGWLERICCQGDIMVTVGASNGYCRFPKDDRPTMEDSNEEEERKEMEEEFDKRRFFAIEIDTRGLVCYDDIHSFATDLQPISELSGKMKALYKVRDKKKSDIEECGTDDIGQLEEEDLKEFNFDEATVNRGREGRSNAEEKESESDMSAPRRGRNERSTRSRRSRKNSGKREKGKEKDEFEEDDDGNYAFNRFG